MSLEELIVKTVVVLIIARIIYRVIRAPVGRHARFGPNHDGHDLNQRLEDSLQRMAQPAPHHVQQSDDDDALTFLNALITHYPVVLFHAGEISDLADDHSKILLDTLTTLGMTPKTIDIKTDITLSRAFNDPITVPQVYIRANHVGGFDAVMQAIKDGSFARTARALKPPMDETAYAALRESLR